MTEVIARFDEILELLSSVRDVVDGRVVDDATPAWCSSRGWDSFLLGLSRDDVEACEAEGPARWFSALSGAPASLRQVARTVQQLVMVPDLGARALQQPLAMTSVRERKLIQIRALLATLGHLAERRARVVDVGCGVGHLTRAAAESWERGAVGLERNHDLLLQASELATLAGVEFQLCDVFQDELSLRETDFVVGLHACGEVADVALQASARARASVAFISCCLQKIRGERRTPLSKRGIAGGMDLSREVLGLSNLSSGAQGVEVSLHETMQARQVRHALRILLRSRGLTVGAGDEMHGLNRRRARKGFETIAADALALRGLAPATVEELRDCSALGREQFEIARRLSLPRNMLARLVECAIVFDRAVFLAERDYDVVVATVFDEEVSPRNLAVVGQPRPGEPS